MKKELEEKERKKAEDLENAKKELEEKERKKAEDLEKAKKELEEAEKQLVREREERIKMQDAIREVRLLSLKNELSELEIDSLKEETQELKKALDTRKRKRSEDVKEEPDKDANSIASKAQAVKKFIRSISPFVNLFSKPKEEKKD